MEPVLPMKETVDLRSYLHLLWRRKWVVIVPAVLCAAAAIIITMPAIMKPIYQSSATLMVEFPQPLSRELANLVANPTLEEQLARLSNQIQSNEFLTQMIANTGMRSDESVRLWARRNQKRYPDLTLDELVDLKLVEYLRSVIHMTALGGKREVRTNVIQVTVFDYYPARARSLVQNITDGIIEANRSEQLREVKSTGDFSATQLQEYQTKLQDAEARLEKFKRDRAQQMAQPTLVQEATVSVARDMQARAAADLSTQEEALATAAQTLRAAGLSASSYASLLTAAKAARALDEARSLETQYVQQTLLEAAAQSGPGQGALSEATAINLSRKLDEVRSELSQRLQESNRGMTPQRRDSILAYLMATANRDLAQVRQNGYAGQIAQFESRVTSGPQSDLEQQRLEQEVESYRELQNTFLTQLASSQISEAFGAAKVGEKISILQPAERPMDPVRPRRVQILLLSMVAGVILGVAGAFFVEHHDPSYRDVGEIERQSGLRVIGTLPNLESLSKLSSARRGGISGPLHAAAVERAVNDFLSDSPGYQEIRRMIIPLLDRSGPGPRSLMVTSARRGEGKSMASVCLALTMAKELPEARVVLVDLDTRKSTLSPFFGVNGTGPHEGLFLNDRTWSRQALRPLPLPNLSLLAVKSDPDRPHDLVTLEGVRWLLSTLKAEADWVIIDSPPNLPVPDALIIGREVESVLMVVRAGQTPRETVRRGIALQRQFQENLVGILLNNCSEVLPYYYHHRHYGYGYASHG